MKYFVRYLYVKRGPNDFFPIVGGIINLITITDRYGQYWGKSKADIDRGIKCTPDGIN